MVESLLEKQQVGAPRSHTPATTNPRSLRPHLLRPLIAAALTATTATTVPLPPPPDPAVVCSSGAREEQQLTGIHIHLIDALCQAKGFHLLSLLRSRIRNIRGVDSFVDAAKVCRKFDPKESAYISWVDFDWCMDSLTLRMSSAEVPPSLAHTGPHSTLCLVEYSVSCAAQPDDVTCHLTVMTANVCCVYCVCCGRY